MLVNGRYPLGHILPLPQYDDEALEAELIVSAAGAFVVWQWDQEEHGERTITIGLANLVNGFTVRTVFHRDDDGIDGSDDALAAAAATRYGLSVLSVAPTEDA